MATPSFEELIQVYLGQGMSRNEAIALAQRQSGHIELPPEAGAEKQLETYEEYRSRLGYGKAKMRDAMADVRFEANATPEQLKQQYSFLDNMKAERKRQAASLSAEPQREVRSLPPSRNLRDNISREEDLSVISDKQRVEEQLDSAIKQQSPMPVKEEVIRQPLKGMDWLKGKRVRQKDPLEGELPTQRKFVIRAPKQMIEDDQALFRKQGRVPRERIQRPENLPPELHYPGEGGRQLSDRESGVPELLKAKQLGWKKRYGKTHTKDGKPLPHTFDPGDPGVGGGAFKEAGVWVDDKGRRLQAGTVKAPGKGQPDRRTRDQLSLAERQAEYSQMLDAQKEFFMKNFTKEDGSFDWDKLDGSSPKIRAAFAHLQHAEAVRSRIEKGGVGREHLHAEGAKEHLYQQAHYTGGVVMPHPERPGQFIVADPKTGDKMARNPAAQARLKKDRQKIANQRRIAENPMHYEQANLRGANRRMAIEARKMKRQGRHAEAAMLELNIDDPTHPAVLLRSGAFKTPPTVAKTKGGMVRKGGGVDWESYTEYAKDWNDRMQEQADMTPAQASVYRMQTDASGWREAMADLDKRRTDGTIGEVEYSDEKARLVRQGEAAKAEVRGFNLKPPKPGTMDARYRRGRDIFAGGSAHGTDIRGKDRWQEWLNLREKMFSPGGQDRGRTVVSEDLRQRGLGRPGHPGAYGRSREDVSITPGRMFRHGPEGGREFIDRDVHKHSITDEQRQAMRDRYADKQPAAAQGQPGQPAPAGPAAPADTAPDRFNWHDTSGSASGSVMPQPPRGIVTADHLVNAVTSSSGGVKEKPNEMGVITGNAANTDEGVLWGAAEQIAAHGKPAQAAWLKAMLRKHPQLKNKAGVRKYIISISESIMPFENTEGLLVLLGL